LEVAVQATDTLVEGIDNAGAPDTPQGQEAATKMSDWANSSKDDLEQAQDSLDDEADTLEDAITQVTTAAGAIGTTLTSGVKTFADIAASDPALAAALRDSSTCQQLRKKEEDV
jgi:LPS sulfotransferase NodH